MSVLKKLLLIGFLVFGIGGCKYHSPEQFEKALEAPTVKVAVTEPPLENAERDGKLQAETDALLSLFDKMPRVPVYVEDTPMLKSGTNTERGAAYTNCDGHGAPSIFVKKTYYQKANQKQLVNSLKHELTHAWLCRRGMMSIGHGAAFRKKFTQVGGFGN